MTIRSVMATAAVASLAGTAMAGTVRVFYTPFQTGNGGEFRVVRLTGYSGETNRASDVTGELISDNVADNGKTLTNTSGDFYNLFSKGGASLGTSTNNRALQDFQTFCLERNETVANNTVYHYSVDAGAIHGGVSGGNPDLISNETAWLYTAFRNNTLVGYNMWGGAEADRESSAKTLQHVIWFLEGEVGATLHAQNPNNLTATQQAQATTWYNAAVAAVGAGYVNGGVRALNLFTDNNGNGVYDPGVDGKVQSQLTMIPLPTAGGLGMAGLLGVLAIRRRVRL